ncbi:hypothetical protein INT45_013460, partial [Circinella minor]
NQERIAKNYAIDALNIPTSIRHHVPKKENHKTTNAFDDEFMDHLYQARGERDLITKQHTSHYQSPFRNRGNGYNRGNRGNTRGFRGGTQDKNISINHRQTTLHHSFGQYQTRGTPSKIFSILENDHITPVAPFGSTRGLQDTIYNNTATMGNTTPTFKQHRTTSSERSNSEIHTSRHYRSITFPEYGVSLKFFHNTRTKQKKTYFGLSKNKSIYPMSPFQNGRCTSLERHHRDERLYVQAGFEGCICGGGTSSTISKIYNFYESRNCIPIQDFGVWNECQPENFFKDNEICRGTFTARRHQNGILSRRHLYISENETGDVSCHQASNDTPRIIRIYYQQGKECINPITQTRLPRVSIQFQHYEDYSTYTENKQINKQNQTSTSPTNAHMQMVCKSAGKNDVNDPSYWRSALTHKTFTKGSSTQPTQQPSKMGYTPYALREQYSGITIVDQISSKQKWITNTTNTTRKTNHHHSRRRIQHRMGSRIARIRNYGILDRQRKKLFNQRQRIIGNFIWPQTTCKKISKFKYKNVYRQYDSTQVCNQIRRHILTSVTKPSSTNTRHLQQIQLDSKLPTYSWYQQYPSRSTQPSPHREPLIRSNNSSIYIQKNQQEVGSTNHRCIRIATESATQSVLESKTGPRSNSSRCLRSNMEEKGNVSVSSLASHTSSHTTAKKSEYQVSHTNHASVEDTILVPDVVTNGTTSTSNDIQDKLLDYGRMEVIREKRKTEGMKDDEIEFLNHAIRKNTNRVYNMGWRKWENWCANQDPTIDPQEYNINNIFKFLMANRQYSVQHLNGIRSAIASVFKTLHPQQPPIAQQEQILQFFQAKRHQEIKIPTETDIMTWDTDILTRYIKNTWANNTELTLTELQWKTLSLLSLATMARPRSDLGTLQFQNIHFKTNEGQAISVIIHFTEAKETNIKSTQLGLIDDRDLCPTTTLYYFIQQTKVVRQTLPKDHTLFLTYLDNKNKKTSLVRPSTVANWIKTIMNKAGIDTSKYKAHSIRSATSTKAVEKSHSIKNVKQHANWSSKADTFEKYYYKPRAQQTSSTAIANSIFSLTENSTTLEDEAESKRIVVGTNNNTIVDEAKSENVVHPPNWYHSFFKKYFS